MPAATSNRWYCRRAEGPSGPECSRERRSFVPSHRFPFLPSDLIRNRVQEIGVGRTDETESRPLARPGEAMDVPVIVLRHTGIFVDGHGSDQHGQALTLP